MPGYGRRYHAYTPLNDNPYKSPAFSLRGRQPALARRFASHGITAFLIGGLIGTALLTCYLLVFVVPPWAPQMHKGDGRLEDVCFVASTLLPITIVSGTILAFLRLRHTSFRLTHLQVLGACIPLWLMVSALRPAVSRVRRPEIPSPMYETIPDTIGLITLSLFVLTCLAMLLARKATGTQNENGTTA